MNTLKVFLLMAGLTMLLVLLGQYFGGSQGALMAFIFAGVMNIGSYLFSDKLVLGMYRAKPLSEAEAPTLYGTVRRLAQRAGLPMPKVAVIPQAAPNAFATGRDPQHAVVAVTEGMLRLADQDELEGVLGHELAHVQHRDMLIGTIAATLAGAITFLAAIGRFGLIFGGYGSRDREGGGGGLGALLLLILAPIAALLIQMAISRSREFKADEGGARISGKPRALASALEKLERAARRIPLANAQPATAHMFIVNPLRGEGLVSLFRTHPPTSQRIARLEEIARKIG